MADRIRDVTNLSHPFVEEIDFDEIEKLECVGKGSFGTVYKAHWRGKYVAVKCIEQESEINAFTTEVRQLSRVAHPNIVGLYGACTKRPHVCLVMEYAEGGSLYNILHCNPHIHYTMAHAMSWVKQCADGVAYLHEMHPKPLIHRDLKPPNLLLINGGRILKICDFGTVTDKATMMTNNKGSAAWMAPEVFEGSNYTEKCDVFSWGIILWEVLSRQQPFKDIAFTYRIMWSVHTGNRPQALEGCPKPIEKLMTTCWDPSPMNRPSMRHVVEIMTILCSYLPGAEQPLEYDEDCETIDTNIDSLADEWSVIMGGDVENNIINSNQQYTNSWTDGRWASPSRENSQPRIISEPHYQPQQQQQQPNQQQLQLPPTHPSFKRNGILKPNDINQNVIQPIQVEIPSTWEQNDYEFQRLLGNITNSQGDKITVTESRPIPPQESPSSTTTATATTATAATTATPFIPPQDHLDNESGLDINSIHLMLEPHLRPPSPDPNNRLSLQIFEEHKQTAEEFLKIQTDLAYVRKHKQELLENMDPKQRSEKLEFFMKLQEKEGLLQLQANLKRQLEIIRSGIPNNENWVIVSANQQQ